MGCACAKSGADPNSSKQKGGSNKAAEGKTADGCGEPPPPPPTDPRLPLNARQKFSIVKSWKGIARAMDATGVRMFIALFQEHEELLNLFEKFRELRTQEEQANSKDLQEHSAKVMETLDEAISSLDNVDAMLTYLHSVGRAHRKVPGFTSDLFWKIEGPFLTAVKETLGDRYTENIENIYKITIRFILQTLIDGHNGVEGSGADSV